MSVSDWSGRARCVVLGEYLAEKKTTVRQAAAVFGVSKSTVHKDVTETLRFVNRPLWEEVRRVLADDARFSAVAELFRSLGDPTRVRIFWLLSHREECVINIAAMLDMSSPRSVSSISFPKSASAASVAARKS